MRLESGTKEDVGLEVAAALRIHGVFKVLRRATREFEVLSLLDGHSLGGGLPLEIRESPLVYGPGLCVPIPKGLYDIAFHVRKRGFVPGELVAVTGFVRNASQYPIKVPRPRLRPASLCAIS